VKKRACHFIVEMSTTGEKTVLFERTRKEMISLSPDRVCWSIVIKGKRFSNGKSEQICSYGVLG